MILNYLTRKRTDVMVKALNSGDMTSGDSLSSAPGHDLNHTERTEISRAVQKMIAENRGQQQRLNALMLEAISLTIAVMTRADTSRRQGLLLRCWNALTGLNREVLLKNDEDLARCAFAAQETLTHLFKQNLLGFEALSVVDDKINQLTHGLDGMRKSVQGVYEFLLGFMDNTRHRFDDLEHRMEIMQWNMLLKSSKPAWRGLSYVLLEPRQKLFCLANDFFNQTKGHWAPDDLYLLEISLGEIGLNAHQTLVPLDLYGALEEDLLLRWLRGVIDPTQLAHHATELTPLALGFSQMQRCRAEGEPLFEFMCERLPEASRADLELEFIARYVQSLSGRNLREPMTLIELTRELIGTLFMLQTMRESLTPTPRESNDSTRNCDLREQFSEQLAANLNPFDVDQETPNYIIVVEGCEAGEEIELGAGSISVGRRPDNRLSFLADPYVSGRHCTIDLEENRIWVTDLNSTNGTFLDGERVKGRVVWPRDVLLKIGNQILRQKYRRSENLASTAEKAKNLPPLAPANSAQVESRSQYH